MQLLEALEREMKRREQERKEKQEQEQQQQPESKNKFSEQRQKLVSLIADLEMLKSLGADTRGATENLETLVAVGVEAAMGPPAGEEEEGGSGR